MRINNVQFKHDVFVSLRKVRGKKDSLFPFGCRLEKSNAHYFCHLLVSQRVVFKVFVFGCAGESKLGFFGFLISVSWNYSFPFSEVEML